MPVISPFGYLHLPLLLSYLLSSYNKSHALSEHQTQQLRVPKEGTEANIPLRSAMKDSRSWNRPDLLFANGVCLLVFDKLWTRIYAFLLSIAVLFFRYVLLFSENKSEDGLLPVKLAFGESLVKENTEPFYPRFCVLFLASIQSQWAVKCPLL